MHACVHSRGIRPCAWGKGLTQQHQSTVCRRSSCCCRTTLMHRPRLAPPYPPPLLRVSFLRPVHPTRRPHLPASPLRPPPPLPDWRACSVAAAAKTTLSTRPACSAARALADCARALPCQQCAGLRAAVVVCQWPLCAGLRRGLRNPGALHGGLCVLHTVAAPGLLLLWCQPGVLLRMQVHVCVHAGAAGR